MVVSFPQDGASGHRLQAPNDPLTTLLVLSRGAILLDHPLLPDIPGLPAAGLGRAEDADLTRALELGWTRDAGKPGVLRRHIAGSTDPGIQVDAGPTHTGAGPGWSVTTLWIDLLAKAVDRVTNGRPRQDSLRLWMTPHLAVLIYLHQGHPVLPRLGETALVTAEPGPAGVTASRAVLTAVPRAAPGSARHEWLTHLHQARADIAWLCAHLFPGRAAGRVHPV